MPPKQHNTRKITDDDSDDSCSAQMKVLSAVGEKLNKIRNLSSNCMMEVIGNEEYMTADQVKEQIFKEVNLAYENLHIKKQKKFKLTSPFGYLFTLFNENKPALYMLLLFLSNFICFVIGASVMNLELLKTIVGIFTGK